MRVYPKGDRTLEFALKTSAAAQFEESCPLSDKLKKEPAMRRLWILGLCLCLVSCSSSKKYGDHPPYPTSGQVLVNGQPAKEAVVVFHHVGKWGERSIVPQGWTDEEGRFVLSTYDVNDGAPAG